NGGPAKAGVAARMAAARAKLRARTRRTIESLLPIQDDARRRMLTAGHAQTGHFVCTLQIDVIRLACGVWAKATARPYRRNGRRRGAEPRAVRVFPSAACERGGAICGPRAS